MNAELLQTSIVSNSHLLLVLSHLRCECLSSSLHAGLALPGGVAHLWELLPQCGRQACLPLLQ